MGLFFAPATAASANALNSSNSYTINGLTVTTKINASITGNCDGSSPSCSGNAATSSSCSGAATTLSGNPTINGATTLTGNVGIGITYSGSYRLIIADGTTTTAAWSPTSYFGPSSGFVNNTTAAYNNVSLYALGSGLFGRWVASVSDIRINKDIEDIDNKNSLQKILLLQPKTFKYIALYMVKKSMIFTH